MKAGVAGGKIKWHNHFTAATTRKLGEMVENYGGSLAEQGIVIGPQTRAAYREGVTGARTPREPHLGAGARASDKWERNYLRGMAR